MEVEEDIRGINGNGKHTIKNPYTIRHFQKGKTLYKNKQKSTTNFKKNFKNHKYKN